jgi:hypothetical protein
MTNVHALSATDLLGLQRMVGNQQVSRMLQRGQSGSTLTVGATHDHAEAEARRMAAQVSQVDTSAVQRAPEEDEGGVVRGTLRRRIEQARGGGVPAPEKVRHKMEAHLSADLSNVRVHHDQEADAINAELGAKASTYGKDIFLARNESPHDVQLMAHEMTHTVQQGAVQQNTGTRGRVKGDTVKHRAKPINTIQREPDEKKLKKLKAKRMLAKFGSGALKFLDTLVTLPLQVIDQLSVLDLHAKDLKNFIETGKTRATRNKELVKKEPGKMMRGNAKRVLGRSGLSGYARGLFSHNLTYGVGGTSKFKYFHPLNPFATTSIAGGKLRSKVTGYDEEIKELQSNRVQNIGHLQPNVPMEEQEQISLGNVPPQELPMHTLDGLDDEQGFEEIPMNKLEELEDFI